MSLNFSPIKKKSWILINLPSIKIRCAVNLSIFRYGKKSIKPIDSNFSGLYLQFMIQVKTYISTILSIAILIASLLPALHVFDHEKSAGDDTTLTHKFSQSSVDCELCDFRIAQVDAPSVFSYEVLPLIKETVHSISLAQTVNLFPNPLFSLRAPPVVNS